MVMFVHLAPVRYYRVVAGKTILQVDTTVIISYIYYQVFPECLKFGYDLRGMCGNPG